MNEEAIFGRLVCEKPVAELGEIHSKKLNVASSKKRERLQSEQMVCHPSGVISEQLRRHLSQANGEMLKL